MAGVIVSDSIEAGIEVDCLIIGGGAAGLTAALAASEAGESVLVAERDTQLSGSTALSSGLVPAAGTKAQAAQSISDSEDVFVGDIMAKNKNSADPDYVRTIVAQIPKTIDWLADSHNIPFHVLDDFLYPSHSHHRMHAVPEVTGQGLITRLEQAVSATDTMIVTGARVTDLFLSEGGDVIGARCQRPDGAIEAIAARRTILACNGYGGNPDLVARHIPEMKDALYFGHPGNQGEAILWGEKIGAVPTHLSGYQGHGSVAHPHGILVTWALMMEGGIQVNLEGRRFSNEHQGYSEQAVAVLAQPEQTAFNIFDGRLQQLGRKFEDFRNAEENGAVAVRDTDRDPIVRRREARLARDDTRWERRLVLDEACCFQTPSRQCHPAHVEGDFECELGPALEAEVLNVIIFVPQPQPLLLAQAKRRGTEGHRGFCDHPGELRGSEDRVHGHQGALPLLSSGVGTQAARHEQAERMAGGRTNGWAARASL